MATSPTSAPHFLSYLTVLINIDLHTLILLGPSAGVWPTHQGLNPGRKLSLPLPGALQLGVGPHCHIPLPSRTCLKYIIFVSVSLESQIKCLI